MTWRWLPVIAKSCIGLLQSLKYLRQLRPDVVIGTGGYVSGPVLFAASLIGIPIAIQEQNASPGLTNSFLAKRAKAAYLALAPESQRFPEDIVEVTGNPIRPGITDYPRCEETYRKLNLTPTHKTVFVMGGSQGARAVNDAMIEAAPLLVSEADASLLQIVHQTGQADAERVQAAYAKCGIRHHVQPFFERVEEIYSITDVMICRAGGMTVSEVTACGIPAIFIPLPAAVGNNQVSNAETVASAGAAVVFQQEQLRVEGLVSQLMHIVTDEAAYRQMKTASEGLGRPFASDTIAESIYRLAAAYPSSAVRSSRQTESL